MAGSFPDSRYVSMFFSKARVVPAMTGNPSRPVFLMPHTKLVICAGGSGGRVGLD